MFNLVRFTLDGVYFVCKTKDLKRQGKKTATKWLDKNLYEVDIITTSQNIKVLEQICANLNSNVPKILLEKFVEDVMVIHSSSENVDVQCKLEKNMENFEECIRCGQNCNLKDHVCSFIARENSYKMSHDGEEILMCSNSGLLWEVLQWKFLRIKCLMMVMKLNSVRAVDCFVLI
ncbi:hypothetical protein WA026_022921 [Henosepilachna vigintioctopunctata]|uniref:Uncharacterized protein n=1 Tax=Henosepilachna vigintioctopunctata TaxID=420089 RepID=A0AAW1U295_9CUCU